MKNILNRQNGVGVILPVINPPLKKTTKSLAYHEAGHAVAAMAIGVCFEFAAINRNTLCGYVKGRDPEPNRDQFIEQLPKDTLKASSIECASVLYAGYQAEFILASIEPTNPCDYNQSDDKKAREILVRSHGFPHANFYCQQLARKNLLTHWKAVEELAEQLLKHGKITGIKL